MAFRIAPPSELRQREERIEAPKHLAWVRSLPSCVSGRRADIEAHHLLRGAGRGFGRKAHDSEVVPLTHDEHMALHHHGNEPGWFSEQGVRDPYGIANELWRIWLRFSEGKIGADERDRQGLRAVRKSRVPLKPGRA